MKKTSTIIALILIGYSAIAQTTFGLKLSEISNDGTNYVVEIALQMQGDTPENFKLGSSSFQFEFPNEALSNPVLASSNLESPMPYFEPTVTTPLPNLCSFNVELMAPNLSEMMIAQAPEWTVIGSVHFTVTEPNNMEPLAWMYNGSTTQTVVYLDDESTQIFLTDEDESHLVVEELSDVSIEEQAVDHQLTIYPNPMTTETVLTLSEELSNQPDLFLEMTNNLGQVVQSQHIAANQKTIVLQRKNLPGGIYHLQLITGKTLLVSSEVVVK